MAKNLNMLAWVLGAIIAVAHGSRLRSTRNHNSVALSHQQRALKNKAVGVGHFPMQTFFIPLPEDSMFYTMFKIIKADKAKAPIESMFSVSVSINHTVIWYDHWEDGYEEDVRIPNSNTTEVWGDGDASNGCAPGKTPCTDELDVLWAGDSIVVQNTVEVPRDSSIFHYDGRDKLLASFGVALTRGAFPKGPGSMMAGAVEVLDTEHWGTEFIAPMGEAKGRRVAQSAFEYVAFYYMAAYDNTTVTLPSGETTLLHSGEAAMIHVNQGNRLTSDKKIQVDYVAGDKGSTYELRWYSLLDVNQWSNEYISPVGDTFAKTKILLFNPHPYYIEVWLTYRKEGNLANKEFKKMKIGAGEHALTRFIPTGSGAKIRSIKKNGSKPSFIALSLTDTARRTKSTDGTLSNTAGDWYDWGFPVMPSDKLTSQVLVGWGYGCTGNECFEGHLEERSVVWVTPTKDADIYVDYDNTGDPNDYVKFPTQQLRTLKLADKADSDRSRRTLKGDSDMSGAVIFATKPGTGYTGPPIDIAVAWGQNPDVSRMFQEASMDLGTVVLPFTTVRAAKVADKDVVQSGEILTYTIRVSNAGHNKVEPNTLKITDSLDQHATYVEGSTILIMDGEADNVFAVADDSPTAFPLDGAGYMIPVELQRRGGTADIQFQVIVDSFMDLGGATSVVNEGKLTHDGKEIPFSVETPIEYTADIEITNTVYIGSDDGGAECPSAVEYVQHFVDTPIVYCFNVTNTGSTYLSSLVLQDEDLSYSADLTLTLPPGESTLVAFPSVIPGNLTNVVNVTGNPVWEDGSDIEDLEDVTDEDPSSVGEIPKLDTTTRTGTKQDCLQDVYTASGNPGGLECTSDDVTVVQLSTMPATCVPGTMINVTVNAEIQLQGTKYDVGWYVAADDGDALTGTCAVSGLFKPNEYEVQSTNATDAGVVSYCDAEFENANECGDVLLYSDVENATVWVPLLVDTEIPCVDDNLDGTLDLTLCLTWRSDETDVTCISGGEITVGFYPSTTTGCHCETYEVPKVTVPVVEDQVAPCS